MYEPFAAIIKDSPAVGDVHVSSTGGKVRRRKPLGSILSAVSQDAKLPVTGMTAAAMARVGKAGARVLKPMDDEDDVAHTPFPWDANALGAIKPDQVRPFFSAITNPRDLETRTMDLKDLTALQDRVEPDKVQAFQDGGRGSRKPPVVVGMNGRSYIADGHHRAAAAWLGGKDSMSVKYKDLEGSAEVAKSFEDFLEDDSSIPFVVAKVEPDQQLIFGWASVVEKGGRLVVDKQGDMILPEDLEKAAYDFVLNARNHGTMHDDISGRLVESMVFTAEKQKLLGIDLGKVAWWTGFKVDDPGTWAAHRRGELPEFSIGGTGRRVSP